jgi:ribonuclease HII
MVELLEAGLDEVGRGPLAGPITIAVAVFHPDTPRIKGVDDSKKLSAKKRVELVEPILDSAEFIGFGWASPQYIDERGIEAAWTAAALDALEHAPVDEMHLVVDGTRRISGYHGLQSAMEKADSLYYAASAASIVAKVSRDLDMARMDEHYPGYGWKNNSGYGSAKHREAILELGVTPYHRITFLKKWAVKVGLDLT